MKFVMTIDWKSPGNVPGAIEALRRQMEALNVDKREDFTVVSVNIVPEPIKRRKWFAR